MILSCNYIILPEPGLAQLQFLDHIIGSGSTLLCHKSDTPIIHSRFPHCHSLFFDNGPLTPSRHDLFSLAINLASFDEIILVRDDTRPWGWESYVTSLGLMGVTAVRLISQSGEVVISPPYCKKSEHIHSILLTACAGIGNVIQMTSLLSAAVRHGIHTAFCPLFDNGGSLTKLFKNTLPGLTLIEPEEALQFEADVRLNIECRAHLHNEDFFYSPYRESMNKNEGEAYANFFENVTGIKPFVEETFVGGLDVELSEQFKQRIVLCPGSKLGWDSKRWPYFSELAKQLDNPIILCQQIDIDAYNNLNFLSTLSDCGATIIKNAELPEVAAILRHAKLVIANDCGLAHIAVAANAPTIILFGPSSIKKNKPLKKNAHYLSLGLDCQPCQGKHNGPGRLKPWDYACTLKYACLKNISVNMVLSAVDRVCVPAPKNYI